MIKQKINKKAFTLVELIVVITILTILGTIAFITLEWYSKDARDSTRISDLSSMKTSLELFHLDAGKYPVTTDWFTITYSGSEVWSQWTFWVNTFNNVSKLDKIPVDPLTEKEYTYSVTKTKQEYQLSWIMEWDELVNLSLTNQANAWTAVATAIVTWNYNWKILKTLTWSNCEILTVPSIVSSLPETTTNLTDILTNIWLVYSGFNNLPSNYRESKYDADWGFAFTSNKLIAYSDAIECKPLYYPDDNTARTELITNLQTAYSWTIIQDKDGIQDLVTIDLTNPDAVNLVWATFVNNHCGWSLEIPKNGVLSETISKLISATPEEWGYFGNSVTRNSTRIIVGVPSESSSSLYRNGAVYLYDNNGNLITTIISPNNIDDGGFGFSVTANENRIIVSQYNDTRDFNNIYIYDINWNYISEILQPSPVAADGFGYSLAIDNSRIVVGAPWVDNNPGDNIWAMYVYDINGTYINFSKSISSGSDLWFWMSVAVDGDKILIGEPYFDESWGYLVGRAVLFDNNGNYIQTIDTPQAEDEGFFGNWVAIYGDRIAIKGGAPDSGNPTLAVVYIYDRNLNYITTLYTDSPFVFGWDPYWDDIAITSNNIFVGAPADPDSGFMWAVYVYNLNGLFLEKLTTIDWASEDWFGYSIGVSGNNVIVGSPCHATNSINCSGAAYLFTIN
jgi:prepilin-type N-terminal cleavage/methylation domain-containing protein